MKFDVCFATDEIRVTLTESLALPEGHSPHLGSPGAPCGFDLLPQIESLVRQFLDGFASVCPGSDGLEHDSFTNFVAKTNRTVCI